MQCGRWVKEKKVRMKRKMNQGGTMSHTVEVDNGQVKGAREEWRTKPPQYLRDYVIGIATVDEE